jgi:hypothetical protein
MTVFFLLPAVDIGFPFLVIVQVSAKDIQGACRWFFGGLQKPHVHFIHSATALAMITMRAGGDNVGPDMLSAQMTGRYVVHRQIALALSTVLAGIIIAAEHFPSSQLNVWTRSMNLVLQSDDGRTWQ